MADRLYNPGRSFYAARPVAVTEEQIAQDLTAAMKARNAQRVAVLRSVVAAAKHLKVEKRVQVLDDAALAQVVRREIRQREEAEEFARKAGRDDLASQNLAERRILEEYVPPLAHRGGAGGRGSRGARRRDAAADGRRDDGIA